ncbi:MAG TPA: MarR family transcriptional regulator [Ramlibacter sp.]|nr:MarR family transcriptional regulator [Ramlibacter sp.]
MTRTKPRAEPAAPAEADNEAAMHQPDSLHLYQQAGHLFRRAQQIAVALFYEVVGEELTPIQYAILLMVQEHPGIDQKALAGLVALDSSTTWQTALRLESKGMLTRELHISGRRYRRLSLTPEGVAVLDKVGQQIRKADEEMFRSFSTAERDQFLQMLHRFVHINNNRSRAPLELRGSVNVLPKGRKRAAGKGSGDAAP